MSRSFEDSGGRSPLIIKDLDLYPQPPTNTRSPTLNSEEPVNGDPVKAAYKLHVGDEVRLRIEGFDRVLGVVLLLAKRVSYPQARMAYDDRTPERPRVHIPVAMREKGSGRPTKKERRELDRLRGYDSHEHY